MKNTKTKLLFSVIAASFLSTSAFAGDDISDLKKEIETLKGEIASIKESTGMDNEDEPFNVKKSFDELKDNVDAIAETTDGSHLKWSADFRTSMDNINYTMADGSTTGNNELWKNRLWLNMFYIPNKNMSFFGQLAYNKVYGQRISSNNPMNSIDTFDWFSSENASDDSLRVKNAFYLYKNDSFLGTEVPWTFSLGRRDSNNGELFNYREGITDDSASPIASMINMSFDGMSAKFELGKAYDIPGAYIKFCAGKGVSTTEGKYTAVPYQVLDSAIEETELAGAKVVFYDDKKLKIAGQYAYSTNLFDFKTMADLSQGYKTIGGLHLGGGYVQLKGISEDYNNFWDNTTLFASFGYSKTNPYDGQTMLGSSKAESGYSYMVGAQFPSLFTESGNWGVAYVKGSKYWRSMTYGEDTAIGSIAATRGTALDVYFNEPLAPRFYFQARLTQVQYDYSGSNGFFGDSGTPMSMNEAVSAGMGSQVIKDATDVRLYLRYIF